MNDLLTDEEMREIRRCSITDYEVADVTSFLQSYLRSLLAHYDATVAKHADIIGNCRSALAGFTGPEENIPDEIVARNAHANSNIDNLRVQVADLELIVATLKNVLLCDEGQLKLAAEKAEVRRKGEIGAMMGSVGREIATYRDASIAVLFDAAKYLARAETAERNLVQAQAELSNARADRDLAQAATKAETICRRGAEDRLFFYREAMVTMRGELAAILEAI